MGKKITDFPIVIFVEGISDFKFMQVYIEHLFGKSQTDFYIQEVKGVENLKTNVSDFVSGLKPNCITKAILLIRDADDKPKYSKQSIVDIITEIKMLTDIQIHSYIFPFNDDSSPGTLETLCLKILKEENKEKYLTIGENAINQSDKVEEIHKDKNRLSCYFSLFDKYCEGLLGTNAEIGAFDFNANELKLLKEMLENMQNSLSD